MSCRCGWQIWILPRRNRSSGACSAKVEHGIFGYEFPSKELRETVAARMQKLYGWQVSPDAVVATPGVIAGFTAAAHTVCTAGQGILVQPPVYPPFLKVHENWRIGCARMLPLVTGDRTVPPYGMRWILTFSRKRSTPAERRPACSCSAIPTTRPGRFIHSDDLTRMADYLLEEQRCHLLGRNP